MRDLGLPVIDDDVPPSVAPVVGPKSASAGLEPASTKKSDVAVQKYQLGPTLPVVPARIMRRVLRGDYVDMAELTDDNLEELCRSTEGEEGKPTPLSKLKPVADPLTWARSFSLLRWRALLLLSAVPDLRLLETVEPLCAHDFCVFHLLSEHCRFQCVDCCCCGYNYLMVFPGVE